MPLNMVSYVLVRQPVGNFLGYIFYVYMLCQYVYFSVHMRPDFVFSTISILQLHKQWILSNVSTVSTVNIERCYMLFAFLPFIIILLKIAL